MIDFLRKLFQTNPKYEFDCMVQDQKEQKAYADRLLVFIAGLAAKYAESDCTHINLDSAGYKKLMDIWIATHLIRYPFPVLGLAAGGFVWNEDLTYKTGLGIVVALAEQGQCLVGLYDYVKTLEHNEIQYESENPVQQAIKASVGT